MSKRKWCTIVPVNYNYSDEANSLKEPFEIGDGIYFGRAPDWLQEKQIIKELSWYKKEMVIKKCQFVIYKEYEAASLGDPLPGWKGESPRGIQKDAEEKILMTNMALWLAKPSCIGFELLFHLQMHEKWVVRQEHSNYPLRSHERDAKRFLTREDLEEAKVIYSSLIDLERSGPVWISVRTLWKALTDDYWEVRFLLFWIILEAIFGTHNEIRYRLSQRIAFFLTTNRNKAKKMFQRAKAGYDWRCYIVHGMNLDKLEGKRKESEFILYSTEFFVRKSLKRILTNEEMRKTFSGEKREEYLDNLIF